MENFLSSFKTKTTDLDRPDSYFKGVKEIHLKLPENILCFKPASLNANIAHHYRFVLILNFDKSGKVGIDENIFQLNAGFSVLVHPFQQHYYLDLEKNPSWLFLSFELSDWKSYLKLKNRVTRIPEGVYPIVSSFLDAYQEKSECRYDHNRLILYFALILESLLFEAAEHNAIEEAISDVDSITLLMKEISKYVYDNIHNDISVNKLCEEFNVSDSHLRHVFKKRFGVSLGCFVKRSKINKACDFLGTTDLSVSEISERCGYRSLYSFSRAFKNENGKAPLEYRKSLRSS